ncbi:MAG: hypothetical protein CML06_04750 [Pseudomonadales bacterium]|nr:hypothetical protein [Pseudomonadales bacterium]
MFNKLLNFLAVFCFALAGTVVAAETPQGVVFIQGKTSAFTDKVALAQETTLTLAFSQLPTGSEPVTGEAILLNGTTHAVKVALGSTSAEVTLPAGEYNLLAYVELGDATIAETLLAVKPVDSVPLFDEQLSFSKNTSSANDRMLVTQSFALAQPAEVRLEFSAFDHIEPDAGFAVTGAPRAVIAGTSGSPVVLDLQAQSDSEVLTLEAGPHVLTLTMDLPEEGASGFFWELHAGDQHYQDRVLLVPDGERLPAMISQLPNTPDLAGAAYRILSKAWQPSLPALNFGLHLEREEQWLHPAASGELVDLQGAYNVYISHPSDIDAVIVYQVQDGNETVVHSDAVALGQARLLDNLQITSLPTATLQSQDFQFVNLAQQAAYALLNGATIHQTPVFTGSSEHQWNDIEPGAYYLVGVAEAGPAGNALLRATLLDSSQQPLTSAFLFAGDGLTAVEEVDLDAGIYDFALVDMDFPVASQQMAIGLYGEGQEFKKFLPTGGNLSIQLDGLDLAAGQYVLALLLVPKETESLLFAFDLRKEEDPTESEPDSSRSSNGSGGGGGGGSLSPLISGLLLLLLVMRAALRNRRTNNGGCH